MAPFLLLLAAALAGAFDAGAAPAKDIRWIGTWAAAPQPFLPGKLETFRSQTVRLVIHTSVGGGRLRIRLSNIYGDRSLVIGAAHVARVTSGAEVDPASDRTVTFGGRPGVTVPGGGSVVSDAADLEIPALLDLAVSLYLPGETPATTCHFLARQKSYVSAESGDSSGRAGFAVARVIRSWPFLTGVEVDAPPDGGVVVAFGDSWVDGDGSTPDSNHRLTDFLATRLQRDSKGRRLGVLNEGLIGNRLLRDSPRDPPSEFGDALGESGLKRWSRDALEQPGVAVVLLRIGVNDLGFPGALTPAGESVSAADLVAAFRSLAETAHRRGIRVVATTIGPFEGVDDPKGYYTATKDAARREVNAWMLAAPDFDAVIDFDRVLRDPDHPARLLPAYDCGDHLHPNDAGYAAAADAIPLSTLGVR